MDKKEYTTPELTLISDVEELTKGQGFRGRDDQLFLVTWNNDPTSG